RAKLKLEANIKIDQYKLLGHLIRFGERNFADFLSFVKGVRLTNDKIESLESMLIRSYGHYYPDKSDDELIYGENSDSV
ncbi:MAG TPA: hypothetical protein VJ044_00210, partial [Candidatus Hodarchaeales archaeon]|nr:hypothetical protein [Candidatus Hodarchaeales archaeon]